MWQLLIFLGQPQKCSVTVCSVYSAQFSRLDACWHGGLEPNINIQQSPQMKLSVNTDLCHSAS